MGNMILCFYTLYEKNENWKSFIKKFAERKKTRIYSKLERTLKSIIEDTLHLVCDE